MDEEEQAYTICNQNMDRLSFHTDITSACKGCVCNKYNSNKRSDDVRKYGYGLYRNRWKRGDPQYSYKHCGRSIFREIKYYICDHSIFCYQYWKQRICQLHGTYQYHDPGQCDNNWNRCVFRLYEIVICQPAGKCGSDPKQYVFGV